ncbi:viral A-type inclusion protein [Clostridium botulinum]|uniref:Putative viral A-type inclusion protein n=1 Tax=Clostridium botulinum (strain Okra / Type B1) TaxID=498213 RepID=B1INY9_CLOBK|nr:transglutaminase domain-containing protein [Clostridium botulinum]ACA46946.1 putative viral A-type inclusion protein [Clostridium botulinum B1 str. Okra]MBD5563391.1 viral A-type inclusion protein [Clostridium botulinum]MBD5568243.1 viral A-type inclusion protein [Clostridium botulinum]MBD5571973.1 viral A-type inclusion protein [Clostridium botulinum]MBD5575733.1 viral A-type inclusion protein [Clostridium botulinum]
MLSKKTKKLITSAILSLTISLSFLGTSITAKAFDSTKAVYELKNARTYEYTWGYDISINRDVDYARGEIYLGSISSTAHQLDTTPFRATMNGEPLKIFNSTKNSLEAKEKELLAKEMDNSSNKNKTFGIWQQDLDGNFRLYVYVINATSGFNKTLKITKEFISGDLDYGLYNKDTKEFSDKLKEVLNSSYDKSDLLKIYKYDIDPRDGTSKIPYHEKEIIDETKRVTKDCTNDMEKVQAIYKFVVTHMEYVEDPAYRNKGALSALKSGKGVCEDYASLFIAMCREVNIPARYVHGLTGATGNHGWAEFYLPYYGWIIAEPTVSSLRTANENTLQKAMMSFIGTYDTNNDFIPSHSVAGYNNNEDRYHAIFDRIKVTNQNRIITIKGEPIKSVVYNQPFSNYQERIDSVNKLLEIAKNTEKEEDIKEARELAQTLIDSEERETILKQLDYIGKSDELKSQIGALVVDLENSDTINTNKFEELKEILNNAPEEIVEEFKTPYSKIAKRYEIENLIKETEGNLTEENLDKLSNLLDNANIEDKYKLSYTSKYDKLLNDYTKKVEEQEQTEYAAKLQAATKAVEKAENSKNQTDVDNARGLANSLKEIDKSNLNARLDKVQKNIDDKKTEEEKQAEYEAKVQTATKAVEKAEKTTIYEDYISATKLVSELQNSEIQTQLWDRLREVKVDIGRKEEATELVKLVEEDNTETNYNRALESINRLRDNELKQDLLNRLNNVKSNIDNNNAKKEEVNKLVAQAEKDNKEETYNKALAAVQSLEDDQLKKELLTRLNNVKSIIDNNSKKEDVTKLVEQAEKDNKEETYNKALTAVKALEDSQTKKDLLNRLDKVKVNIDKIKTNEAIHLVEYAEKYPSISTYNNAKDAVNSINDGNTKTELLNRLKNVEIKIEKLDEKTKTHQFIDYVDKLIREAEKLCTEDAYKKALEQAQKIEDVQSRKVYINRLNEVKNNIDINKETETSPIKTELDKLEHTINSINTVNKNDMLAIKEKINDLKDTKERQDLIDKLNNIENKYNKLINNPNYNKLIKYNTWNNIVYKESKDKTFAVKFNKNLNSNNISENLYLLDVDNNFEKIHTTINIKGETAYITADKLSPGKKYILVVSDQIKDSRNKDLKQGLKTFIQIIE